MNGTARRTAVFLIAVSALSGTARGRPRDDVQSLKNNETQWNRDFVRKDVEGVVRHYAEDGVLMLPGSAPAIGRAAIGNVYRQMIADPAFSLHFAPTNVVVSRSGDLGYTRGTYQLSLTSPKGGQVMHTHGPYVTDYRRTADGSWKATIDVVLQDTPDAAGTRR